MPQIDFVIADTPDGGVSLRTSFSPAIGAPCSPAQHLALEVIALHHRQTILKPTCAGAGAGAGAVAIPRNPLPRLYLCGPMTHVPGWNASSFRMAAATLRGCGYEVLTPLENGLPITAPWAQHLRADIPMLCRCDAVALVQGAATDEQMHTSRGVALELHNAQALGLRVAPVMDWVREVVSVGRVWEAVAP